MNAIAQPWPTRFVPSAKAAVMAMIRDISMVMMMPVIQRVLLRPHLST